MNPTIVTLTPRSDSSNTVTVASFEDAFGEFSEARGRGRARRAKRKAERQTNRQAKRTTRIKNRGERKQLRQVNRAAQQEARQTRKDVRKTRRVARKAIGDTQDGVPTEENLPTQDGLPQEDNSPLGVGTTQGGGAPQGGGSPQDNGYDSGSEDMGGEDTGSEDMGGEDVGSEDMGGEDMGGDEGSYGEDEGSGFDGDAFSFLEGDDFYNAESDDYFTNADGNNQPINPKVKSVAQQIEDCKEHVASLQTLLANAQNDTDRNKVNARIYNVNKRISELEASLEGYSSARGRGKQEANRRKEVKKAKQVARKNRVQKTIKGKKGVNQVAKALGKMYPPAVALKMAKKVAANQRQNGGDETPVDAELNPEFSPNQIVIPAAEQGAEYGVEEGEGFNGQTGLIGIDNQGDFDAPQTREFDLTFSGADGSGTKLNLKAIAIGVGVGILAIYLIKKYNK